MSSTSLQLLRTLKLSLAEDLVKVGRAIDRRNNPNSSEENHLMNEGENQEKKEAGELKETEEVNECFLSRALKRFQLGLFAEFYQHFHSLQVNIETLYEKGNPDLQELIKILLNLQTFRSRIQDREHYFGKDYDTQIFNNLCELKPELENMQDKRIRCFLFLDIIHLSLSRAIFFEVYKSIKLSTPVLTPETINEQAHFLKLYSDIKGLKTALSDIIKTYKAPTQTWLIEFEETIAWVVERAKLIDGIKGDWERVQYFSQEMSSVMEFSPGICVGQTHEWFKEPVLPARFRSGLSDMRRLRCNPDECTRVLLRANFEAGSLARHQTYLSLFQKGQFMPHCKMMKAVSKSKFETDEVYFAGAFKALAQTLRKEKNLLGAGLYFVSDTEGHFIGCKVGDKDGVPFYLCLDNNDGKYRFKTIEMMQQFFVQSFKILGYDEKKYNKYHIELALDPALVKKAAPTVSDPLSVRRMR